MKPDLKASFGDLHFSFWQLLGYFLSIAIKKLMLTVFGVWKT
jgi:hypothetical protein